jgi:uncharacterized membrane protein
VDEFTSLAARVIELLGVATILLGAPLAAVPIFFKVGLKDGATWYQLYRLYLARAILLGLEFLIAGDIVRTVTQSPTLYSVAVLAGIVLIRTFLSFTLEVETEGHWPWNRKGAHPPPPASLPRE